MSRSQLSALLVSLALHAGVLTAAILFFGHSPSSPVPQPIPPLAIGIRSATVRGADPSHSHPNDGKPGVVASPTRPGLPAGAASVSASDSGADASGAREQYLAELRAWLEQRKIFPAAARIRRQQGEVWVAFTLDASGRIHDVTVLRPSPFPRLNEAAMQLIVDAREFKPIPQEAGIAQWQLQVPIIYKLD